MKLTPEQINQIIEGLENKETILIAIHEQNEKHNNTVRKLKNGKYKNRFCEGKRFIENTAITKDEFIDVLVISGYKFTFELVTINKDKSETRTKI